jgi:hypothetical protein|tara:strand:- start:342 stop:449 length:108 start_codon:yes stop_codon:yes gene_type:complete
MLDGSPNNALCLSSTCTGIQYQMHVDGKSQSLADI